MRHLFQLPKGRYLNKNDRHFQRSTERYKPPTRFSQNYGLWFENDFDPTTTYYKNASTCDRDTRFKLKSKYLVLFLSPGPNNSSLIRDFNSSNCDFKPSTSVLVPSISDSAFVIIFSLAFPLPEESGVNGTVGESWWMIKFCFPHFSIFWTSLAQNVNIFRFFGLLYTVPKCIFQNT